MPFPKRLPQAWRLRTRTLSLGPRTLLAGILNITPDSFSDGGLYLAPQAALSHALTLLDEGADFLDLGAESTRPNATPLSAAEEQARLLPVLKAILRARPDAILSIDTYHAATAQAALDEGAEIINDVSGLLWDPEMAALLARTRPGAILMHTRGRPRQWAELPPLPPTQVLPLVVSGLTHTLNLARQSGLPEPHIVLDPGFGFGKIGDENNILLAHLHELSRFHLPLLAGLSRKRFLTPSPGEAARDQATLAAQTAAILAGAHILRTHNISAARLASQVADAILAAGDHPSP